MALALTGRPIPTEAAQFETRSALMADGTGQPIRTRVYSDLDLEALRAAVVEAEVVQAVGRVRGGNREAGNPVAVFVFADVVLPLPVTRMISWDHIRPNVVQRMAARGLVLTSPTDAHRVYPDLFPTPDAARMALRRGSTGEHSPMNSTLIGECSPVLGPLTYQPAGERLKPRKAWVTPDRLPGLAAWLTERLGVPVRILEPPPEPPPADKELMPLQPPPRPVYASAVGLSASNVVR